jgi:dTDP-4-amino-4,6-dideoxygalactose transaminase
MEIKLTSPHLSGLEIEFASEAISKNELGSCGKNIARFEDELKNFTDSSNIVLLNSGSSAIHMALILLDVKSHDEVICPAFAPISTINPIIYQGAKPLFVDAEESSWCMSPLLLECALRDRFNIGKRPKAIIVTHAYGNPANMKQILEIAECYNLPVIEDASVSLGSTYMDKCTGTLGTMGVYSFDSNNLITSCNGGALVSESKILIERARQLNDYSRNNSSLAFPYQAGYDYAMNNICAGVGLAQMKVLEERIRQRKINYNYYRRALSEIPGIGFQNENDNAVSNRFLTCITIDPKRSHGVTADKIWKSCLYENIKTFSLYKPIHTLPTYKDCIYFGSWTSDLLHAQGLCLPSSANLTKSDLDRVISIIMIASLQKLYAFS